MELKLEVCHVSLEVNADFDQFTQMLEQSLGRFDQTMIEELAPYPHSVEDRLNKTAGEEGLMLFNIQDHGKLLSIFGNPAKAKQYVLGNPLIAATMTRHDIRAGLYAPLRILVYESNKSTLIDYDLPSSLFGQFNNADITIVAQSLDSKLTNLICKTELLAKEKASDHGLA